MSFRRRRKSDDRRKPSRSISEDFFALHELSDEEQRSLRGKH